MKASLTLFLTVLAQRRKQDKIDKKIKTPENVQDRELHYLELHEGAKWCDDTIWKCTGYIVPSKTVLKLFVLSK